MSLYDLDKEFESSKAAEKGTGNFDPIPEDERVNAAIIDQNPAIVGAKETPCVKVTFEVMEGPYKKNRIWHDFWLTSPNVPYLKRDLEVLGWDGKISDLINQGNTSLLCLGANVTVGVEAYVDKSGNNRKKNTIKFFNETYEYTPPEEGNERF